MMKKLLSVTCALALFASPVFAQQQGGAGGGSGGSGITALTGDCAASGTGSVAITCTQTNGVAFGTFATANAATPPVIGGTTPAAITGTNVSGTFFQNSSTGHAFFSRTAPTVSTGFTSSGTTTVTSNNGTAAIVLTLPGTGSIQNGVITLSGGTTGYVCNGVDRTTAAGVLREISTTSTTVTISFTGGGVSDVLQFDCMGY